MTDTEKSCVPTILDYLNEDVWRTILDYVPVKDIIKSERVSKEWQRVVLVYLRGARIGIEHPYPSLGSNELSRSVSWLLVRDQQPYTSFKSWCQKLGPSVASTYCESEECLRIIGEECPNLEAVKFLDIPGDILRKCRHENFRWLQRICFIRCPYLTDHCIKEYATSYALEELEIHQIHQVTGECLRQIKPNLQSLVVSQCKALSAVHFPDIDRFSDLRKLVLSLCSGAHDSASIYCKIITLLGNIHTLEHFEIYYRRMPFPCNTSLIDAVCKLRHLRHLGGEIVLNDVELDLVMICCTELRSLDLENCFRVTSRGIGRVCNNGRLTALGFHNCYLSDDDVVACVRACPDLTRLDVRRCRGVTRAVLPRAAAARLGNGALRPLHLYINNVVIDLRLDGDMEKYHELILHF